MATDAPTLDLRGANVDIDVYAGDLVLVEFPFVTDDDDETPIDVSMYSWQLRVKRRHRDTDLALEMAVQVLENYRVVCRSEGSDSRDLLGTKSVWEGVYDLQRTLIADPLDVFTTHWGDFRIWPEVGQ